ncbi:MAG: hypothetical protein M1837_001741 [Sclerophora amabilis]|nr:MAG: hypothetical protein M1837_001741 [Sclerophora amabilis]
MVSPGHSAKRRPLHERSESQNNAFATSTVRIVPGSQQSAASSPFPTLPSHLLSPNQGSTPSLSENSQPVSDPTNYADSPTSTDANDNSSRRLARKRKSSLRTQYRDSQHGSKVATTQANSERPFEASQTSNNTGAPAGQIPSDTGPFKNLPLKIKKSSSFAPLADPPAGAEPSTFLRRKESAVRSLVAASSANCSTTSFVKSAEASQPELAQWLRYAENQSLEKLAPPSPSSTSPTWPVSRCPSKNKRTPSRTKRPTSYYSAFPSSALPSASRRSSSASANPPKPKASASEASLSAIQASSQSSKVRHVVPASVNPSSTGASRATLHGSTIVYPVIRPPAASGLWADSLITIPKRVRMNENALPRSRQWSTDLSTVMAESEPTSQSQMGGEGSTRSSQPTNLVSSRESSMVAEPYSSRESQAPRSSRVVSTRQASTIRIVSAEDDRDEGLPKSRWPAPRQSSRLADVPPGSPSSPPPDDRGRAGSRRSDTLSNIPTWARYFHRKSSTDQGTMEDKKPETHDTNQQQRVYYTRPARDISSVDRSPSPEARGRDSAPSASPESDRFPQQIYRPRTRPRITESGRDEEAEGISAVEEPEEIYIRGPPRPRVTRHWSPRLRHDKRAARMSLWEAPQLSEKSGDPILTNRRAVQIALFCVGLIFPLAWMIGAVLSLPPQPKTFHKRKSNLGDLEAALQEDDISIDHTHYYNTVWWRNLNRIMSVVGVLMIGAIIALVVVAIKMRDS